jgi:hypothetical protein
MIKIFIVLSTLLVTSCYSLHFNNHAKPKKTSEMHRIRLDSINSIADTIINIIKTNYEEGMVIDSSDFKTLSSIDIIKVSEFIKNNYSIGTLTDSSSIHKLNSRLLHIFTELYSKESDTIEAPCLLYNIVKLCGGYACGGSMYEYELININGRYNIGKRNSGSYVD